MLSPVLEARVPHGFTVRAPSMGDLEEAVELFNTCSMAMIGAREVTVEAIGSEWRLPDFDLADSARIVLSPSEKIVGYAEVWDTAAVPVHPWVWGRVHPDFEHLGIGSYLLAWAEERARRAIPRVPAEARVAIWCGAYHSYAPARRLLEDHGFQRIRSNWRMRIELSDAPPAPQWPEGITVRPLDPARDARAVYLAQTEAFRDHFGHVEEPLDEGFERWARSRMGDSAFDPSLWFLALDGDDIAGIALCRSASYEDPGEGYVDTLGVRRAWRRQGLGLALLRHAFGELYRRGRQAVALNVDSSNLTGATRLYERAGMYVQRQLDLYEKELRPGRELAVRQVDET